MLRAAIGLDNLQLLLPMITTVDEVDDALLLIQRACDELEDEGYDVMMPPVDVMVEVPAAVYQADALARRVSFLSVGTNDLTPYLRSPSIATTRMWRPSTTNCTRRCCRTLMTVVAGARVYGREVSVCGEMAGDPLAAVLLLGVGVHDLSMGAGGLLRVKGVIRGVTAPGARTTPRRTAM